MLLTTSGAGSDALACEVPSWVQWMRSAHATEVFLAGLRRKQTLGEGDRVPAAIQARQMRNSYGGREVLRGLDLDVAVGEVFCLLGPNGAGKTTTVEILEGFRSRSGGEVRVLGVDPEGQPAKLRQRVGIVLQECALPGELRVRELIDAYRSYYPTPLPTDQLLSIVELQDQSGQFVRELSGGQQRRVDLALALVGDPDLVFLDEPTTGFDPAARRRTWAAIRNLATLGKTIVLTTHYLEEAQQLSDRVAVIVDGRIVSCDTPDRLADRHRAPSSVTFEIAPVDARHRLPLIDDAKLERDGGRFTISTRDPESQLRTVFAWARRSQVSLSGLAVTPPSLEDIYLKLVGPIGQDVT